jgi:hypothetical protein
MFEDGQIVPLRTNFRSIAMHIRLHTAALLAAGSLFAFCTAAMAQTQTDKDKVTHYTAQDGTQVTLTSGQPKPRSYGPKPAFEALDTDHDGIISRAEAQAYMPLFNDYDDLVHHTKGITKGMYARWDHE